MSAEQQEDLFGLFSPAAGVHKLREGQVVKPTVDPYVTGDGKVAIVPMQGKEQFAVR